MPKEWLPRFAKLQFEPRLDMSKHESSPVSVGLWPSEHSHLCPPSCQLALNPASIVALEAAFSVCNMQTKKAIPEKGAQIAWQSANGF